MNVLRSTTTTLPAIRGIGFIISVIRNVVTTSFSHGGNPILTHFRLATDVKSSAEITATFFPTAPRT